MTDTILRDPVSSTTHFLMAGAAVVVAVFMLRLSWHRKWRRVDVGMFGFSMIFLYTCSGLFHAVQLPPDDLFVYRNLDMTGIYFLIASSFTPLIVTFTRGRLRAGFLALMWALVVAGVLVVWLAPKPSYAVIAAIYIGLGLVGMLGARHYLNGAGRRLIPLMIVEPVVYIGGAVLDVIQWPTLWPGVIGPHEIFHLAIIAGTLAHIGIMMQFVIPPLRQVPDPLASPKT